MADCVPRARAPRKRVPRDVERELRCEIGETLAFVAREYDASLASGLYANIASPALVQRALQRALEVKAATHAFRLALTPRVQRVLRHRYAQRPNGRKEEEALTADCFAHLLDLTNEHLAQDETDAELAQMMTTRGAGTDTAAAAAAAAAKSAKTRVIRHDSGAASPADDDDDDDDDDERRADTLDSCCLASRLVLAHDAEANGRAAA